MQLKSLIVLGAALVVASGERRASFVQCEDSSLCPDGATCCKIDDEAWGCCPYEFGQCCEDGRHCCPTGYSCDGANSSCTHKVTQQRLFRTLLARDERGEVSRESSVGNVRCPDGNYCLDGQTCCLLTSGHYGCCPYQHAECCSDHSSCCPEGYQCRVSTHQCIHAITNHTVAMVKKVDPIVPALTSVASLRNELSVQNIRCPDGNYCNDGQTCCLLTSGQYGCCPYAHAQCCSDHASCCPEGYICKVSTRQCLHAASNHTMPMVQKVQPVLLSSATPEVTGELIRCPDGAYCQDTQTCCLQKSGRYGCCPYVHAQCCSDHASCCPEGFRCKVSTRQCIHATSNHTVAMLEKVNSIVPEPVELPPQKSDESSVGNVRCPDGNYCLDGQTCCLLTSGHYGCCPYQHAECCSDHSSCCPEGYQCRVSTHQCIHATTNHTVAMVKKVDPIVPALTSVASLRNVPNQMCPDGNECQDDQTCCLLQSGSYGCCPYNQAVCCDDREHCCPAGYTCDTQAARCLKGDLSSPLMRPLVPKRRSSSLINTILVDEVKTTCPDQSTCPDKMTCCQSTNSTYVCCPFDKATCCEDGEHCCPEGYQCDEARRMCTRKLRPEDVPALNEFPSDANL
ncbi:progranulin-like isoform X2 [Dermacentor variabilis]|uniref:progranulin-like isoform X2 n=1 Tax=Dermacentor variabilis TaxID=34621 RepID=UPI003F5CB0C0